MTTNVIIAGVGGQGSILASRIIADAVILGDGEACGVRVGETFGAAMRGGAVSSHVRIGCVVSPLVEKGRCDLIVGLEPLEALRVSVDYLRAGGTVVLNSQKNIPTDVKVGSVQYPDLNLIVEAMRNMGGRVIVLDGDELALQAGSIRAMNVVMLGAAFATGLLPVARGAIEAAIAGRVPPRTVDINRRAFLKGQEVAHESLL